jgi:hypothetical protein
MDLQVIQNKIYDIRGQKEMLDFDLAEMYDVQTKVLKQAVRRNIKRFPPDFMFVLTSKEWELVTICDQFPNALKHSSAMPFAFAEQGVAMLSGILKSDRAIEVNINIMRAFVLLRQYALGYAELNQKLENFMIETNMQFNDIYQALTELMSIKEEQTKRKPIGFRKEML